MLFVLTSEPDNGLFTFGGTFPLAEKRIFEIGREIVWKKRLTRLMLVVDGPWYTRHFPSPCTFIMFRFCRVRLGKRGARSAPARSKSNFSMLSRAPSSRSLPTGVSRMFTVKALADENDVTEFQSSNPKSILYFTANWCGPCKMIKPVYEEMSKRYQTVAFGKVDVDENEGTAMEFEINAVPTFIIFDGDKPVNRLAGADPEKLEALVKQISEASK